MIKSVKIDGVEIPKEILELIIKHIEEVKEKDTAIKADKG